MKRSKTIHSPKYTFLIDCLCQERKRLGLSQVEVAELLHMTQSEISKIENGDRRIDILEFKELINIYRINENPVLKKIVLTFLELELDNL